MRCPKDVTGFCSPGDTFKKFDKLQKWPFENCTRIATSGNCIMPLQFV